MIIIDERDDNDDYDVLGEDRIGIENEVDRAIDDNEIEEDDDVSDADAYKENYEDDQHEEHKLMKL